MGKMIQIMLKKEKYAKLSYVVILMWHNRINADKNTIKLYNRNKRQIGKQCDRRIFLLTRKSKKKFSP